MYKNFKEELIQFFVKKSSKLKKLGHTKLIIDPGFGFGKTIEQNFKMINLIPDFNRFRFICFYFSNSYNYTRKNNK